MKFLYKIFVRINVMVTYTYIQVHCIKYKDRAITLTYVWFHQYSLNIISRI